MQFCLAYSHYFIWKVVVIKSNYCETSKTNDLSQLYDYYNFILFDEIWSGKICMWLHVQGTVTLSNTDICSFNIMFPAMLDFDISTSCRSTCYIWISSAGLLMWLSVVYGFADMAAAHLYPHRSPYPCLPSLVSWRKKTRGPWSWISAALPAVPLHWLGVKVASWLSSHNSNKQWVDANMYTWVNSLVKKWVKLGCIVI